MDITREKVGDVLIVAPQVENLDASNTKEFRRCVNWQHWGKGEYVAALEPANGSVEGRDVDRKRGELDSLKQGATKTYAYRIEVLSGRGQLSTLWSLNAR